MPLRCAPKAAGRSPPPGRPWPQSAVRIAKTGGPFVFFVDLLVLWGWAEITNFNEGMDIFSSNNFG